MIIHSLFCFNLSSSSTLVNASQLDQVHTTTAQIYQQLATEVEPFKLVDVQWLACFLQQLEAENGGFSSKILTLSWLDKGERIPYNG